MRRVIQRVVIVMVVAVTVSPAFARHNMQNRRFTSPVLSPGQTSTEVPGWTISGAAYVQNVRGVIPGYGPFHARAPNVASVIGDGSFKQDSNRNSIAGWVDVLYGRRPGTPWTGAVIEIIQYGQPIERVHVFNPHMAPGTFAWVKVQYWGRGRGRIFVVLTNVAGDGVVDYRYADSAPAPGSLGVLACAALALRRRRR